MTDVTRRAPASRYTAAASAALLAAAVTLATASTAYCSATNVAACGTARGPFRDDGTKVLAANGSAYVPYGITVPGLAHADYQDFTSADDSQIRASAQDWCANTVRLQVSQDTLVGARGTQDDTAFMAAIKAEVSLAESYNLVVVINAQTQDVGREAGPTHATHVFWNDIAAVYGHDPQVVFDLFNEPHVNAGNTAADWKEWQDGGTVNGTYYLGQQTLLSYVRADGAANLTWIEGPFTATTLARVKSYPVTGGPLMYEIHHPTGAHNSAVWWADFGYLVKQGIAPVVDGEWTNYALPRKSECWPDAPAAVPAFLKYLGNHGIGMTAWKLVPGVLLESSSFTDPTHIRTKTWNCTASGLNQGAGNQILHFFESHNGKA
jgi:endoglucanase